LTTGREYFDVVVIIPLEEELEQFVEAFPETGDRSTDTQYRATVDPGNASIKVLVALQEDMGKGAAAQTCASILKDYDVGLLVCMGIPLETKRLRTLIEKNDERDEHDED
jgi:hypothetical protein